MKFGIAGNLAKAELPRVVELLLKRFISGNVSFVLDEGLARGLRKKIPRELLRRAPVISEKKIAASCDILVSLGGDGTILRLARIVGKRSTPILGINLGKLGFLAEVSVDELDSCLDEILRGEYHIEDRMVLHASSPTMKDDYFALNDVVVDLSSSSRMVNIATYVDREYLATFTGDGVIVSTPTGSTGYALSNGGPIVTPTSRAIMISPICPHTLTARPVVVSDDATIVLRVQSAPGKVHVTADGQPEQFLKPPMQITIKKARHTTRLVKRSNTSYYEVLRKKLNWGRDLRINT